MTTNIKTDAHCSEDKEVEIITYEGVDVVDKTIIQNDETHEGYVCDDRIITVREVEKS